MLVTAIAWRLVPSSRVGRWRLAVFGASGLALVLKLVIAANTFGTDDVHIFTAFAQVVREHGPVEIYGQPIPNGYLYNHAPLSGWMLVVLNKLNDFGIASLTTMIRWPASVADCVAAFAMFELVRLYRGVREAGTAAILTVLSPMLLVISGFHGNTDPVFVMFCLLSAYLLIGRRWTLAAGMSFAAAISVKIVPIVLIPVLLVWLFREGRPTLVRFIGGAGVVLLPLWGPVLLTQWSPFSQNVLGYGGIPLREWGIHQMIVWLELAPTWADLFIGPGRYLVLLVAASVPAAMLWRRPGRVIPAFGLPLILFLFLSPAFSMQYLVWPLAASYLVHTGAASAYNVMGSALVLDVYSSWNDAYPWNWYEGRGQPFTSREFVLMMFVWLALGFVAWKGATVMQRLGRRRER